MSLSIQEPLMKILAGLEYILRKAQVCEHLSTCINVDTCISVLNMCFMVFCRTGKLMQPHMCPLALSWRF